MSYKAWRVQEVPEAEQKYIVRVDYNDTEGHPGTCYYGEFTKDEADNFCREWDEDDTELEDAMVIFLNAAVLEEIEE
jgi:hypothetical protein